MSERINENNNISSHTNSKPLSSFTTLSPSREGESKGESQKPEDKNGLTKNLESLNIEQFQGLSLTQSPSINTRNTHPLNPPTVYQLKDIQTDCGFGFKWYKILVQNENGPCPLLALCKLLNLQFKKSHWNRQYLTFQKHSCHSTR